MVFIQFCGAKASLLLAAAADAVVWLSSYANNFNMPARSLVPGRLPKASLVLP